VFRKIKILNIPAISFILRRSVTILLFRFSLFTAIFLIPEILEAQGHFLERYVILTDTVCRLDTALNILERSTGC
jgi:hypothetical protein